MNATGPTRGDAIALSPDEGTAVVVNRDVGSVTVFDIPSLQERAEIALGGEPWQVVVDGRGERAYVILRESQKLVELIDLQGTPIKGREVSVGSEPTGLTISPTNGSLYVANWVDGTVSVVDAVSMTSSKVIDVNAALADSGLLGSVAARPGLAHPRSLVMTNDGDDDDADESLFVTEFFAQRTAPEASDASNADVNWVGIVYEVTLSDDSIATHPLAPLDAGFVDSNGAATQCFPNQLQSITLVDDLLFVTSICVSPKGPVGPIQKGACSNDSQCGGAPGSCAGGSCQGTCTTDADCGGGAHAGACTTGGSCQPVLSNVKTLTHPAVHVLDALTGAGITQLNLNKHFDDAFALDDSVPRRYPLVANDVVFEPGTGNAFITANGADAVFKVSFDLATGTAIAPTSAEYVDLASSSLAPEEMGHNPIGLAMGSVALVANDVSRNVTAVDVATLAVSTSAASADLPTAPEEQSRLQGKRFFNTGLDRWSLRGQAWGACQTCHFEGLSDNVTWYFARGPRQSTSLDGSFASNDPSDQRIFNWTAVFDEIHDFENVARSLNGAVGALVTTISQPPANSDRINLASATLFPPNGASGLNGSAEVVNDTVSVVKAWDDVEAYIQSIRSPRAATGLDSADVTAGEALFIANNCNGCHGGAKWTLSRRFYQPSGTTNADLLAEPYDGAALVSAGFPAELLPATTGFQFMRFPTTPSATLDQIQCVLRPVGTFAVSSTEVNVVELRQDMTSKGQGEETNGNGFNVPSILGMQVGAPYFHAGNARTLEELLSELFDGHHAALSPGFVPSADEVRELVAYLLSIDEATTPFALPTVGADGGDFCAAP